MESLAVSIASERRRLFVGREAELAALDAWLGEPDPPTRLFHVTGMGGIGKSTLLRRMVEQARAARVTGIWIDGRATSATPAGFLAYLAAMFDFPGRLTLERIRAGVLTRRLSGRAIWCVDNYEALEPIHEWLWEAVFPELPARGHLVVLASRGIPAASWRTDPGWRTRARHLPLEPWSPVEATEYLRRVGIPERHIEPLVRATGGQPLAVALAADAFLTRAKPLEEAALAATREVSASLMWEAAGKKLEPLLEVLAVVPEVDLPLFREVADAPPSDEQLLALGRLSFVEPTGGGFGLHDVARRHLLTDLRDRDPARFRILRRRAVHALMARLDSANRKTRRAIAASLLTISADTLPSVEPYANLNALDAVQL
ncbi:MAG TPA: ATP-binding protein, partial [Limnochorda sp.]